jgi:hypothetical protein
LKHEVGREANSIPPYRQVQIAGGDLIEVGKIRIQNDLLFAQQTNTTLDVLNGNSLGLAVN